MEADGFKTIKHQSFVRTGYFDALHNIYTLKGQSSTTALAGSTETEQFH